MNLEIGQIFELQGFFEIFRFPVIKKQEWQGIDLTKFKVVFVSMTNQVVVRLEYYLKTINGRLLMIMLKS